MANEIRRIIEIGYDLPRLEGGIMWFRVGAQPHDATGWAELLSAIAKIDYNEFDGVRAAEMLAWAGENAKITLVEFGREYSPVLYLHPAGGSAMYSGGKAAINKFMKTLVEVFDIHPDEVAWDKSRRCLRLWWD